MKAAVGLWADSGWAALVVLAGPKASPTVFVAASWLVLTRPAAARLQERRSGTPDAGKDG